jgi:hypothetical protein
MSTETTKARTLPSVAVASAIDSVGKGGTASSSMIVPVATAG